MQRQAAGEREKYVKDQMKKVDQQMTFDRRSQPKIQTTKRTANIKVNQMVIQEMRGGMGSVDVKTNQSFMNYTSREYEWKRM